MITRRDDHAMRDTRLLGRVVTFAVLLLTALVENALGHVPALAGLAPRLTLVMVFILCMYHAPALGLWGMFIAGLVFDLTEGNPPGFSPALMLLTHLWVMKRRVGIHGNETARVWNEFIAIMGIVTGVSFVIAVIYTFRIPAIQPLLLQYGLTVLSFPIVLWLHQVSAGFMSVIGGRSS